MKGDVKGDDIDTKLLLHDLKGMILNYYSVCLSVCDLMFCSCIAIWLYIIMCSCMMLVSIRCPPR